MTELQSNDAEKTATEAYYATVMQRPADARARAQAAYTVAAAITTALVAAGVFGHFTTRPWLVKILGLLAVAAWTITAIIFMVAVGWSAAEDAKEPTHPDFVPTVIEDIRKEVKRINEGIQKGIIATGFASALTFGLLIAAAIKG